jgi:hypothetical protein
MYVNDDMLAEDDITIIFLIVPLALFHIFLRLNFLTRASSGMILEHVMQALHSLKVLIALVPDG